MEMIVWTMSVLKFPNTKLKQNLVLKSIVDRDSPSEDGHKANLHVIRT